MTEIDTNLFEHPVINSPYEYSDRHWELDDKGQQTQKIIERRRLASFVTPTPKPKKQRGKAAEADQPNLLFNKLDTQKQQYNGDQNSIINDVHEYVYRWRNLPQTEWTVTAETIRRWRQEGIPSGQIGVFVRSNKELGRASQAVSMAGETAEILDDDMQPSDQAVAIGTMHRAKGLEYRAVAVMACDEDILPSTERLLSAGEQSDMDEIYNTERYLLYVAATRAREELLITAVEPGSEFLEDLL
jgi:superfamily I DNA/RNA helicase